MTPCCTIGFAVSDPVDPAASRVFARSAFEYGHDGESAAAAFVVTVV
jgi:hypothetical protein